MKEQNMTPVEWLVDRWIERGTLDRCDINKAKLMEQKTIINYNKRGTYILSNIELVILGVIITIIGVLISILVVLS
jgi:hypothetical protein